MVVRMIELNLFVFQFASNTDKSRVVQGCPWFFDNQLLLLKEVKDEEQIAEIRGDCTCMGGLIEYDDIDPLSFERYIGLKVTTGVNTTKWVDIKYERLGDFCYFCGRLGHIDRDCSSYVREENNGKYTVYRYGPWLRASPLKRSWNLGVDNEKEKRY
ncbi:Zinc finger CCHC domain-containing protein 13 [Bienertia sinuspersici]